MTPPLDPAPPLDPTRQARGGLGALALVGLALLAGVAADAQPRHSCRCGEDVTIPVRGGVRALVVFVRFADAPPRDDDCSYGSRAWPAAAPMPSFADALLAERVGGAVPDSSLTAFFLQQSRGNFRMTGRAVGYTTARPRDAYRAAERGRRRDALDIGAVTREALVALDDDLDYREFDANGDGYLDHAFFVIRGLRGMYVAVPGADGVSSLGFSEAPGGEAFDGVGVCSGCSGSVNRYQGVDPMRDLVQVLAHEFGHDLFAGRGSFPGHLDPIAGNGVPYVPRADSLDRAYADLTTGYALMLGVGRQRHRAYAADFMSAFERDLVSLDAPDAAARWIDCRPLRRDTTVVLRSYAATGDCVRLDYAPQDAGAVEALYLTNLQQDGYFFAPLIRRSRVSRTCTGCRTVETGGPWDTGLLVERTTRRSERPFRAQRDAVPADNGMRNLITCDDVTVGEGADAAGIYDGDLWDPDAVRQLTPWTRPTSFGTTFQRDAPAALRAGPWPAFDALRYADAAEGAPPAIAFDFVHDVREAPRVTVREDSWMDAGSDGLVLAGRLVVASGATLVLEDGVDVGVRGGVLVEPGASLVVRPGATLRLGPDAFVEVAGALDGAGARFEALDPARPWLGLRRVGAGRLSVEGARVAGTR